MADQVADAEVDLAQITDGLRAEREQGITIDVAYRYFATPQRSFIIADTPGHVRYTRNMVTGASTADLAVVLIDARNGVVEQSRRHACLSALLGLRHVVVRVNKMDLVDWDEARYREIEARRARARGAPRGPRRARRPDLRAEGRQRGRALASARRTTTGRRCWSSWRPSRSRATATSTTSGCRSSGSIRPRDAKPGEHRLYAGQVASGVLAPATRSPRCPRARARGSSPIETADGPLEEACPPMSVSVRLADDLDVGRGDLLAAPGERAAGRARAGGDGLLDGRRAAAPGREAAAQAHDAHRARDRRGAARAGRRRVARRAARARAARAQRHRPRPPAHRRAGAWPSPTTRNRVTGAFVLVDELTRDTVAAGMVRNASEARTAGLEAELAWEAPPLAREERWDALGRRGATVWLRARRS